MAERPMTPAEVPDFIKCTKGVAVSRRTVDHWLKPGVAGIIIDHVYILLMIYVTRPAAERFLARVDQARRGRQD